MDVLLVLLAPAFLLLIVLGRKCLNLDSHCGLALFVGLLVLTSSLVYLVSLRF